jgi:hypothetical protein
MERKLDGNVNAISIHTGIKSSEMKPVPLAPFVDKTVSSKDIYFGTSNEKAPSEDIPATTNAPVTESTTAPVTAVTVISEKTNETKCEEELAPTIPPVPKTRHLKTFQPLPMHLPLHLLLYLLLSQAPHQNPSCNIIKMYVLHTTYCEVISNLPTRGSSQI